MIYDVINFDASEKKKLSQLKGVSEELRRLEAAEDVAIKELVNATGENKKAARALLHAAVEKVTSFRAKYGLDPEGVIVA